MEEFIIAGESIFILDKDDIDKEIDLAKLEQREADFKGKNLKFLSLAEKNIEYGINLQGSRIVGNLFLASTIINGNLNMADAIVDGSFFFGRGKIMGSLILERAKIGQPLNLVGLNTTGSLLFAEAQVNGFISLAKAVILGDVDFKRVKVSDYSKDELTVKGDIYLKSAQVNGFFDISEAEISGMVNLENALIRRSFLAKNMKIKDSLVLKNSLFNREYADFTGTPPEKITE
jgi:cytoskeletal protein CcmA (bactofilin family)